ncbi:MAG: hypothetical protein IJ665_02415 [Phocaeicola sp.]|nr:hypothetical protein [Phocaeicola sp.]
MVSIKALIKKSHIWRKYEPFVQEKKILTSERKKFAKEAQEKFKDRPLNGSYKDYLNALNRHRVTYGEYMHKFEFWNLNEAQRDEFISCSEMQCIYRKTVQPEVKTVFWNKNLFLNRFHSFAQRRWIEVRKSTYEQFSNMLYSFDCIAKPIEGWRGQGIKKIPQVQYGKDVRKLYEECFKCNILLEECIHACKEIEGFHPQSLNTIRVVTISNPKKCVAFGAILRMGTGNSIIDNTHNGGVFASIDIKTGIIETDGLDSFGNHFIVHPDTKKVIKGFQIPFWDKVIETCTKASKVIPQLIFAGWDVVIMEEGRIALIEANHAPDFDGGMQAPKKVGVKQRVKDIVMDLYGIDPLQFISIKSGTLNGYRYYEKVTEP